MVSELGNKSIMASNIKRHLDKQGLSVRMFASKLGFKYTTVLDWVNAKTYPRIDKIEKMATFFGVEKSELIEEYNSASNAVFSTPSAVVRLSQELNSTNYTNWVKYGSELLEAQKTIVEEPSITYNVKTVSSLAAGLGFSYDDSDTTTVQVTNEPPKHDIASIVSGDSMLPNYHNGDVVYLVDKGISNYSGQVCAVAVNDKTYLKRVYTEPNTLRLVSINPNYPDISVDFPPSEDTHIKIFSVVGSDRTI